MFKLLYLIFTILFLFNSITLSQDREELTKTPRKTMETHLKYLQIDNYSPSKSSQTLVRGNLSQNKIEDLATKLKKILDAKGLYVNIESIPDDKNYVDSITGKYEYIPFKSHPEIYLKKRGDLWLYSKETIENIDDIYYETFPFAEFNIENHLPEFLLNRFLGMKVWKFFGLLIYFLISLLLYKLISWILGFFIFKILNKYIQNKDIIKKYLHPLSDPLSALLVFILIHIFLPLLEIPIKYNFWIENFFKLIIPLTITIGVYRISDLLGDIYAAFADKTASTLDDQLVPLVRKILKGLVIILGFLYILSNFGIEITPILAGASLGGLAFALAAQDTLKNFFGAITIYTDQPFEIGDWIAFDGGEGVVEEIRIRSTRIRTFYNSLISIPNGRIADIRIDNLGRRVYRRYKTTIGLTYDTPPELIEAYVEGLREIIINQKSTRKDVFEIHLNEFGPHSLDILVYIFFYVENWSEELKSRQIFILESIRLADELGVRFAFPTSTIHIEEIPGQSSLTPKYDIENINYKEKAKDFIRNRKDTY